MQQTLLVNTITENNGFTSSKYFKESSGYILLHVRLSKHKQ